MPPRQVELPVLAIVDELVFASIAVLPKNTCRCDAPGLPGKTIGSTKSIFTRLQVVRNEPEPSVTSPLPPPFCTSRVAEPEEPSGTRTLGPVRGPIGIGLTSVVVLTGP